MGGGVQIGEWMWCVMKSVCLYCVDTGLSVLAIVGEVFDVVS